MLRSIRTHVRQTDDHVHYIFQLTVTPASTVSITSKYNAGGNVLLVCLRVGYVVFRSIFHGLNVAHSNI